MGINRPTGYGSGMTVVRGSKSKTFRIRPLRLFADGAIYNNETERIICYITSTVDIEDAWSLRGKAQQDYMRAYMKKAGYE